MKPSNLKVLKYWPVLLPKVAKSAAYVSVHVQNMLLENISQWSFILADK